MYHFSMNHAFRCIVPMIFTTPPLNAVVIDLKCDYHSQQEPEFDPIQRTVRTDMKLPNYISNELERVEGDSDREKKKQKT